MYPPSWFARCFNVRVSTFECRDLLQYGLPLTPSYDPLFDDLFRRLGRATVFMAPPEEAPELSAILQNESGKTVVAWTHIWRYTGADGRTTTHTTTNLRSSLQMDVLTGLAEPARDAAVSLLPGSKRLITREATFGDNSDVVEPGEWGGRSAGGGGGARWRRAVENVEAVVLVLDGVFFENGAFAGPDESGVFDATVNTVERQRIAASEMAAALRRGATRGVLFDILRPLARHSGARREIPDFFAHGMIHQLIEADDGMLLERLDTVAAAKSSLHRI